MRGQLVAAFLARALGLEMLASAPDPTHTRTLALGALVTLDWRRRTRNG